MDYVLYIGSSSYSFVNSLAHLLCTLSEVRTFRYILVIVVKLMRNKLAFLLKQKDTLTRRAVRARIFNVFAANS